MQYYVVSSHFAAPTCDLSEEEFKEFLANFEDKNLNDAVIEDYEKLFEFFEVDPPNESLRRHVTLFEYRDNWEASDQEKAYRKVMDETQSEREQLAILVHVICTFQE